MSDVRSCPRCGIRHARSEDVEPCALCLLDGWAIELGLSIRRFVRRAEVEGLVADVRHETMRHDYHCNNRRSGCGCRGDRAQRALDRLAALAMEGHGDG